MSNNKTTVFPRKRVATRVKHRILENCLNAWGGIIITSNQGRSVRLAFVDTCCGSGLYTTDDAESDDEYDAGSALIGIKVLSDLLTYGKSAGRDVSAKALFINERETELNTLRSAIEAQDKTAVLFDTLPKRLELVVGNVTSFCNNCFAFFLVDPYGPSAIPFSVVSQLVQLRYSDCLINFPYYSIHKWVGWLDSGEQEGRLAVVDALLNGAGWRDIARRHTGPALETAILEHYMKQLARLGVGVFALQMSFEDRNRTLYHLIFTSRNTAGLAAAKKEFQHGEAYQAALKAELKAVKQQQGLFSFMAETTPDDPVDVETLAKDIHAHFNGRNPTLDEVIRYGVFKPHVLDSHVRKALTHLKARKMAKVTGRTYRDRVSFAS